MCPLEDHMAGGIVNVLVQARGTEYTPYTEPDRFTTVENGDQWDGTGIPKQ